MKYISILIRPMRLIPAVLIGLSLLTAGCATYREETCAQFEERGKEADYGTRYVYSESDSETAAANFKHLPRGRSAVVRLYKMNLDPPNIYPCSHLTIRKEIYLQRIVKKSLMLEEIREFYSADGTLIATKTERLGDQLRTSGYYAGNTSLPIPENAPLGKYRIVSKLVLKTKTGSRPTVLAKTSARFQIVPRK